MLWPASALLRLRLQEGAHCAAELVFLRRLGLPDPPDLLTLLEELATRHLQHVQSICTATEVPSIIMQGVLLRRRTGEQTQ